MQPDGNTSTRNRMTAEATIGGGEMNEMSPHSNFAATHRISV